MFSLNDIAIGKASATVMTGLPPKACWFRTHPEHVLRNAKILYRKSNEWYLLGHEVDQIAGGYIADLYLGIDIHGTLWILVATHAGGPVVRNGIELARTVWMKRAAGEPLAFEDSPVMEHRQPAWPEALDFEQLLNEAFADRFINDPDHPLLRAG